MIGAFYGHERCPLLGIGGVEAHGEMHLGGVEQGFHLVYFADGRHGYALRAPCQSPGRSKHLDCLKHGGQIIHRFAHAHEYYIGERPALGYRHDLVDDVTRRQVAVESLSACHAEFAPHAASRL